MFKNLRCSQVRETNETVLSVITWEQRKLNEIAVINPSESLPSRFYYIDLDAVNRGRITNRKKLSLAEAPSRAQRVAHLQDVFFQNVRPYQKNNVIYSNSSIPTVFSSGYTQIRTKIDSEFMISALEDDLFVHNVLMHSTGTSYPAISSKQLGALQLFIPEKKETEYVGSLFNVVDNLIAANERQNKNKHLWSCVPTEAHLRKNILTK
ncbi:hypothetical protein ACFQET_05720 [Levilactobacillus tangyuanensis]|uniref:Type I restriction modification DNA specificity domain-containing protein n=1 Tax=Levilactobacillus tangyuanensis TaxID=2486021 RepID=A0ABW1TPA9_9LACO|nr:hypothetical protein [Levilactobacillus tangyuanensis]